MENLHSYCCRTSLRYHQWHKHPLHSRVHWGVLAGVLVGAAMSMWSLGFTGLNQWVPPFAPDTIFAQSNGFDTRKQKWLASADQAANIDVRPDNARQYVLAWIEGNKHTQCRPAGQLPFNEGTQCEPSPDGETACMHVYVDAMNRTEKIEDMDGSNPRYNDLNCIAGNIPGLIRWKDVSGTNAPGTLARMFFQYGISDPELTSYINNVVGDDSYFDASPPRPKDMQPLKTTVHYLAAMRSPCATVRYGDRGPFFSAEFSYSGDYPNTCAGLQYNPGQRTYTPGGGPYNALIFSRDFLYAWMESIIDYPNIETNSRSYQHQTIIAMHLLYDFGEPEMKKRAKMFLDLMMLDIGGQFSVGLNHWGGVLGRTYRFAYENGEELTPLYIYWGANQLNEQTQEGFASAYRLPQLVEQFPQMGSGDWMLKRDNYRNNVFTTESFSIAAGDDGEWRITARGAQDEGYPFDFWINDFAGDLSNFTCSDGGTAASKGRVVSTCGGDECYSCLGANGYLYRNNLLITNLSTPTLHFTSGGRRSFDVGMPGSGDYHNEYFLNENNWNYLQEGNTAFAIYPGPGAAAVEVAVIDPTCSKDFCYSSFSEFSSPGRTLTVDDRGTSGASDDVVFFKNKKGVVIDSTMTHPRPTDQRLLIETDNPAAYVSWNNKMMEVSGPGGACRYDFNTWTTSPSGCEGVGGTLGTGNPVCPDGICNGSETKASCPLDCSNTGGGNNGGSGGSPPNKPTVLYCPSGSCP